MATKSMIAIGLGFGLGLLAVNGCKKASTGDGQMAKTKTDQTDVGSDQGPAGGGGGINPYFTVFVSIDGNGREQCLELDGGTVKLNQCQFGDKKDETAKAIWGARPTQVWGQLNQTPFAGPANLTLLSAARAHNIYMNVSGATVVMDHMSYEWATFPSVAEGASHSINLGDKCLARSGSATDADQVVVAAAKGDQSCIQFQDYNATDFNSHTAAAIASYEAKVQSPAGTTYKLCAAFSKNQNWESLGGGNDNCLVFDAQYSKWDLKEKMHNLLDPQITWPFGFEAYSVFNFGNEERIGTLEPIQIGEVIHFKILTSKPIVAGDVTTYDGACVGMNEGPKADGTNNRVNWTHAEENQNRCLAFRIWDSSGNNDITESYFDQIYGNQAKCASNGFETCMQPLDGSFSKFEYFAGRMRTCDKKGFIKYCNICMDGRAYADGRGNMDALNSQVQTYYRKVWGASARNIPNLEYKDESHFTAPAAGATQYHDYSQDCVMRRPI